MSSKSVHNVLSNLAQKQTDRQTDTDIQTDSSENIASCAAEPTSYYNYKSPISTERLPDSLRT